VASKIVKIELPEICNWIESKGGPSGLTIPDVFELINSYLFETPPSGYTFVPTLQNIFGVIDYYFGFNGDAATGCDFYPGKEVIISNIEYPDSVELDEPFDIIYDCINSGMVDELWGVLIDGSSTIPFAKTYWVEEVSNVKHVVNHFDGIKADLHIIIKVGRA